MWTPETLQYGCECLLYRQADCKGLLNYSPTVVQLTMEVFRRFKREREVTGDSPLRGTGCRHGLKMSSFVIGNALQCLEIRFSRPPAHSPSCRVQVTLALTGITVTLGWITTPSIHKAFQQLLAVLKQLGDPLKWQSKASAFPLSLISEKTSCLFITGSSFQMTKFKDSRNRLHFKYTCDPVFAKYPLPPFLKEKMDSNFKMPRR